MLVKYHSSWCKGKSPIPVRPIVLEGERYSHCFFTLFSFQHNHTPRNWDILFSFQHNHTPRNWNIWRSLNMFADSEWSVKKVRCGRGLRIILLRPPTQFSLKAFCVWFILKAFTVWFIGWKFIFLAFIHLPYPHNFHFPRSERIFFLKRFIDSWIMQDNCLHDWFLAAWYIERSCALFFGNTVPRSLRWALN